MQSQGLKGIRILGLAERPINKQGHLTEDAMEESGKDMEILDLD